MDQSERLSATSFLLGMAHGGIAIILDSPQSADSMVKRFTELELKLRTEINRLFYQPEPTISLQEPSLGS